MYKQHKCNQIHHLIIEDLKLQPTTTLPHLADVVQHAARHWHEGQVLALKFNFNVNHVTEDNQILVNFQIYAHSLLLEHQINVLIHKDSFVTMSSDISVNYYMHNSHKSLVRSDPGISYNQMIWLSPRKINTAGPEIKWPISLGLIQRSRYFFHTAYYYYIAIFSNFRRKKIMLCYDDQRFILDYISIGEEKNTTITSDWKTKLFYQ